MLAINTIKISSKLLRQISDVDVFKGLWTGLERHTTGLQLLGDVADYGANFNRVLGPLRGEPISPAMICVLHAAEMKKKDPSFDVASSAYKAEASQLLITSSDGDLIGVLDTADSADVSVLLEKLCGWVNAELSEGSALHSLVVIAIFTSVFLQISPFSDGNMRVVQFLILVMLLKAGYTYAPYASLAPIMSERAGDVFRSLKANQRGLESGQADWGDWLGCFLRILQAQKDILDERLSGKADELGNLPALSAKIMALFKEHQRLQMKEIIKLTRGRRATIKLRLLELCEAGYLRRHGQGRGTFYSLI